MASDIYSNRVLELAAGMPDAARLEHPQGSARRVSRVCGSEVQVDLDLDGTKVSRLFVEANACALGQAAASVLAREGVGADIGEIAAARDSLHAMLKSDGPAPVGRFWELRHLEGVRDYPSRHASVMLAFDAALDAIERARLAVSDV